MYSQPVDRSTGLICDQLIEFVGFHSHQGYPEKLRRIRFKDPESGKTLIFLTNNLTLPALTICLLYKNRWSVELFSNGSSNISASSVFTVTRPTP